MSAASRFSRWPGRGGIKTVRRPEVQKIAGTAAYRPAAAKAWHWPLAVVVVDDPRVAALPVLSLAVSAARAGSQVIVADLTAGAAAAKLQDQRRWCPDRRHRRQRIALVVLTRRPHASRPAAGYRGRVE